ncbi:DoxX family protein [Lysobacter terrae]
MRMIKSQADSPPPMPFIRWIHHGSTWLGAFGRLLAPATMRVALALPFLRSGLTRWDDFPSLSYGTVYLFEEQFKLHVFGQLYALPAPDTLALLVAIAEIVLPTLLLLGLATRFASLGLLLMTGVIQLVVPEGWVSFHLYWAALALGILALGPGCISIDHVFARLWRK